MSNLKKTRRLAEENRKPVPKENQMPNPEQHQNSNPEQHQSPNPEQHQSPNPEQHQNSNPEQHTTSNPEQHQNSNPEQHTTSNPKQHQSPNPEQHQTSNPVQSPPPNPVQNPPPNPEQHQSPNPEQHESPNPEHGQTFNCKQNQGCTPKQNLDSTAANNDTLVNEHVLFLVGRFGNGKSRVRDSIVRMFQKGKLNPDNYKAAKDSKTIAVEGWVNANSVIAVCDGFSIYDSDVTEYCKTQQILDAIRWCKQGFTALLIVLKYGVRFTKQEKDAISLIKYLFGEDCIRNHGIIVFSYGDNFDLDHEDGDTQTNFSAWCREQRGDIHSLFNEVNNRCVIFDNSTKDFVKETQQWEYLYNNLKLTQSKGLYKCEMKHLKKIANRVVEELKTLEDKDTFETKSKEANELILSLEMSKEDRNTLVDQIMALKVKMNEKQEQQKLANQPLTQNFSKAIKLGNVFKKANESKFFQNFLQKIQGGAKKCLANSTSDSNTEPSDVTIPESATDATYLNNANSSDNNDLHSHETI